MYLLATWRSLDTVVKHPETCKITFVETANEIKELISLWLNEYVWDEELETVHVDLDRLEVMFTTIDKEATHWHTQTWYLLPIERFAS